MDKNYNFSRSVSTPFVIEQVTSNLEQYHLEPLHNKRSFKESRIAKRSKSSLGGTRDRSRRGILKERMVKETDSGGIQFTKG